jgi:hypothetical protein
VRIVADIELLPRLVTFIISGPLIGRWNQFLEWRFPLRMVGSSSRVSGRALAKRVAADQLLMAPIGVSRLSLLILAWP